MSDYKKYDELKGTDSIITKESILTRLTAKDVLAFVFCYDPYKTYNIGKYEDIDFTSLEPPTDDLFYILYSILKGEIKGKEARSAVSVFSLLNGDLIKLIISKDMQCGVGIKTLNKVFPKLIPEFKIEKAKVKDLNLLTFPQYVQMKYDGVRLVVIKDGDQVQFKSSGGRNAIFPKLENELLNPSFVGGVLDCELIWDRGKQKDRDIIKGKLVSAMKGGVIDESRMYLKVFDYLSLSDFKNQYSAKPYQDRFKDVGTIVHKLIQSPMIHTAQTKIAESLKKAELIYSQYVQAGYEGIILKDFTSFYTFKKCDKWVKVKEVIDADLVCVATTKGTGKYKGAIAALTCIGLVEGEYISVNVSGLPESVRFDDPKNYIGQIIEIKYNSVTKDQRTGQHSLFLPRYSRVRQDKETTK